MLPLFICSTDHKRSYDVKNPIERFNVAILHMKRPQIDWNGHTFRWQRPPCHSWSSSVLCIQNLFTWFEVWFKKSLEIRPPLHVCPNTSVIMTEVIDSCLYMHCQGISDVTCLFQPKCAIWRINIVIPPYVIRSAHSMEMEMWLCLWYEDTYVLIFPLEVNLNCEHFHEIIQTL